MASNMKKDEAVEAAAAPKAEDTVTIRLPRTKKDQEDLFVSVNERTWIIQRGVNVEVPACVAEVIRHAEDMQQVAFDYEQAAAHG